VVGGGAIVAVALRISRPGRVRGRGRPAPQADVPAFAVSALVVAGFGLLPLADGLTKLS
jgi:hypothetical protein